MKVSVPGKLYISGEYGVLQHGHALIAPVTRKMTLEIHPHPRDVMASRMMGVKIIESKLIPPLALKAYQKAIEYLNAIEVPKKHFLLTIHSELNDGTLKLGLGSSGALSVGIIEAVLLFHGIRLSRMKLFKMSVLSQFDVNNHTSFGDLSVHAYRRFVLYRKFDEAWLRAHINEPLDALVNRPWKGLKILPFDRPEFYGFAVNSRVPASSSERVKRFREKVSLEDKDILTHSMDAFTLRLFHSLQDRPDFKIISTLQCHIDAFSTQHNLNLVTHPLKKIIEMFESFEGESKLSGAGGGDCVIGFFDSHAALSDARQAFIDKDYLIIDFGGGIHE